MTDNAQDNVSATILAGGLARRMGGIDKPLADLAGIPMIAHVIARLRPQVSAIAINANGDPSRFAAFGLPILPDTVSGFIGPLAGLLAGLEWARTIGAPLLLSAPADAPFLPPNLVGQLGRAITNSDLAVAKSRDTIHPTIALWRASLADDLATWLSDPAHRAVHEWIDARRAVIVDFPDAEGGDPFFNANTPAELDEAARRVRRVTSAIASASGARQ